jgi:Tol biopolymer transport system component/DNA-binding winged helix-turn-helix (wHTH) protein
MSQPRIGEVIATGRPGDHEPLVRTYAFGQFKVEVTTYELWRDSDLVTVSPKAFDTLLILVRNRARAVGKDELMDLVWPDSNVTEDSLTQCISTLRRALGDDPNHPRFIATVSRRGYRFIAPVTEVTSAVPSQTVSPSAETKSPAVPAPAPAPVPKPVPQPWLRRLWPAGAAALLVLAFLAVALVLFLNSRIASTARTRSAAIGRLRFTVEAPEGGEFNSGGVLSPDGRYLAFVAEDIRSGSIRLGVNALDSAETRVLPGTDGASRPFWSPDSRWLGFFADGKLKRVGLDNGPPQVVTVLGTYSAGATWSAKGVILYAGQRSGLFAIPDSGGAATPVTSLNPATQEVAHRWPQFLPDGEHFLFFKTSAKPDQAGTWIGSVHSRTTSRVLDTVAVYAPPGYLVYLREHLLMAQRFDADRLQLSSSATVVDPSLLTASTVNEAGVTAANNGMLAFGGYPTRARVKWFDRSGAEIATVDTPTAVHNPAISPDQKQVLVGSREVEHGIWLVDLDRNAPTRFVPDGMRPQWSPDGTRVAYTADRLGSVGDIFMKPMSGRDNDDLLLRSKENKMVDDWSPDGRYIVYSSISPRTKTDIWILPTSGDRKPRPLLQTPADELQGQISPDGHWIAYTSNESGVWEVYLQSFPEPGAKRTISIGGGTEPHWRRDGRELFYLSLDRTLMSVNMTLGSAPPAIERARPLFRAAIPDSPGVFVNYYAVSADGQRFLICAVDRTGKEERETVLVNWSDAPRR